VPLDESDHSHHIFGAHAAWEMRQRRGDGAIIGHRTSDIGHRRRLYDHRLPRNVGDEPTARRPTNLEAVPARFVGQRHRKSIGSPNRRERYVSAADCRSGALSVRSRPKSRR
jgi:hypothetical protein